MKKLLVILIAFHQCLIFGQNSPCVNDVSTDPNAPTNSNLPNDNHPNFNYDQLFLNGFNWVPFNQSGTLGDLQTIGLSHLGGDQHMFPLYNPALGESSYYQYIRDELVMPTGGVGGVIPNHQQGWELLAVNLGFYPDGTPYTDIPDETNKHPRIPYVILYHRYLSKIRVFANVGDTWSEENAYQAVRIRLSLNTSTQNVFNGLFRLQEGLDRTLDQPTNVGSVGALAETPNDKQRWFSADFTVAFDPCVCDHPSAINLDFELVKNWDFKLYGRGVQVEEEIVDEDGSFTQDDFFSSFTVDFDEEEFNDGGFIMYKKMGDMFDDYIDKMEAYELALDNANQHNERVERNLAIVKWVKYAVEFGVTAATGGGSVAVSLTNDLLSYASGIVGSNITSSQLSERWVKVFEEAEKIIGTEIMTFVNDNFKTQEPPSVPVKPTANFSEMYFEGRLQQVDPKNGPTIYTPGTYGNSITEDLIDQHHYPVYNEPLGVFALLEKPKIQVSRTISQVSCDFLSIPNGIGADNFISTKYNSIFQFKLEKPLNYEFNNALEIKDYSVEASLVFNGKMEYDYPYTPILGTEYGPYVINDPAQNVNIESIAYNTEKEDTLLEFLHPSIDTVPHPIDSLTFRSIYLPTDVMNNFVGSFGALHEARESITSEDQFNTEFCDLTTTMLNEDDVENRFQISSTYLKLIVNVTYEGEKSDGTPHEYTYMFTYAIDPSQDITYDDLNPLYPNLPGSAGDISQYPENLYLNGESFDGSPVDGCQLNGNTYLCKAWNDVELSGEFTVANNYEVIVEGGEQVTVLPESETPPEMSWQVVPVLDYSNPMPPADQVYVSEFCQNSNEYQARQGTKSLLTAVEDSTSTQEERIRDNFVFNIYPNPTSGRTTVSITLDEAAKGELFITDINGRRLESAFNNRNIAAGQTEYQLPTQTLSTGIYLVHLFVDGEHHVKRLIKN